MKFHYVNLEERPSHYCVCVGAMLTLAEVRSLIDVLDKFNVTDLFIYYDEEYLK